MAKLIVICAITLAALTVSASSSWACACCETWKVIRVADDDVLNVRSGPGISYRKVGAIPSGSGCVIKTGQCKGNWCRVSYIGTKGWVSSRYLQYIP